ncbi:hypothetical protein VPHD520_0095 [Vibrio phage D520]
MFACLHCLLASLTHTGRPSPQHTHQHVYSLYSHTQQVGYI